MTMPVVLTLFCTLIVGVSLLGGVTPLALVFNHTRLQVYLSFSAGTMLGAAFFHMLPEAVELGSPGTVRWAAVGLLSLFFLERFFSFHHHESSGTKAPDGHDHHGHDHGESSGHALSWGTAAFGLAVHSLVGGVALASAAAADFSEHKSLGAMGLGVFLATFLHKPADALTIVTLMLRSGVSSRLAHLVNLGFALMIPMGAALFFVGVGNLPPQSTSTLTAVALSFSAACCPNFSSTRMIGSSSRPPCWRGSS